MEVLKQMPQVISDYVTTSNLPDPDGFVACFAEDAVVVDEGQDRQGKDAINSWSAEYHFAVHVKLEPVKAKQEGTEYVVTCKIDGDFDKTGLPDPLLLDYHFHVKDGKITRLSID